MNTYLVSLASRATGEDQRILVQSVTSDDMQEFVESERVRPALRFDDPVVIAISLLRIKRPVRRTTMTSLVRN